MQLDAAVIYPRRHTNCRPFPNCSWTNKMNTSGGGDTPPSFAVRHRGNYNNVWSSGRSSANCNVYQSPSVEERLAELGVGTEKRNIKERHTPVVGSISARSSMNSCSPRSFGSLSGRSDLSHTRHVAEFCEFTLGATESNERKSARLSAAISRRISDVCTSMDHYDKSVRDVNDSLQEAYRKSVQDQLRIKQASSTLLRSRNSSPRLTGNIDKDSPEIFLLKCKESLDGDNLKSGTGLSVPNLVRSSTAETPNDLIVPRECPRKLFGLDATPFLKSSSSEASSSGEDDDKVLNLTSSIDDSSSEDEAPTSKRLMFKRNKSETLKRFKENIKNQAKNQETNRSSSRPLKRRKNRRVRSTKDLEPRSLSPIMPSLPDKQFQTMLKRREERATRHLNSMKNELAQLNHKVELDKKKADLIQQSCKGSSIRLTKSQKRLIDVKPLYVIWNNIVNS